jgi:TfoX/Sxy family transcriptional regulator of competence genes
MKWRKSPAELIALFDEIIPDDARVERRQMFGYPAAFTNGHLFCGLHQENLVMRLDETRRAELTKAGAATFEPMPGRPMKEYVVAPAALLADRSALKKRIAQSLDYVASLPAKKSKSKAKAKAATPKKKSAVAKKKPAPKKR